MAKSKGNMFSFGTNINTPPPPKVDGESSTLTAKEMEALVNDLYGLLADTLVAVAVCKAASEGILRALDEKREPSTIGKATLSIAATAIQANLDKHQASVGKYKFPVKLVEGGPDGSSQEGNPRSK